MKKNRTLLEKADLAIADLTTGGGILKPAQAQRFMRLLVKQATLMPLCTVVPMAAPKQQIQKIKIGQRVLRPGQEATALPVAQRTSAEFSMTELDAKLFKAEVRLNDEVLDDNIERADLRQTILQLMAEAIARDMEELIILGDTTSADPFLATLDGILKQAQSHVVDAGGAPLTQEVFLDLLTTIPSEQLRNKKQMRMLTSVDAELRYRNRLSNRNTVVGDKFLEEDAPVVYSGVPVAPVPLFPENLGALGNETNVLLTDPKNIHVGIWRQIKIESAREISEGVVKTVATLRFDVKYADELGTAKAINVSRTS
jgi:hypothetical protein